MGGGASGSHALAARSSRPSLGIPLPRSEVTYRAAFTLFTRAATRRGRAPEGGRLLSAVLRLLSRVNSSHLTRPFLQASSPSRGPALPAGPASCLVSYPQKLLPLGPRAGLGHQSPRSPWGGFVRP